MIETNYIMQACKNYPLKHLTQLNLSHSYTSSNTLGHNYNYVKKNLFQCNLFAMQVMLVSKTCM